MKDYKICRINLQNEPIGSGSIVKLCEKNESEKIHNIYGTEKLV